MLEAIEKLLNLQERDRQLRRLESELARIEPERESWRGKAAAAQARLEQARQRVRQLEMQRKELELEVEAKKRLIERYALQQFETRKNEEYRALAHEIEQCREAIRQIEDRELDLMEQGEAAQAEVVAATQAAQAARALAEEQLAMLGQRAATLRGELAGLREGRAQLAAAVEEDLRVRYERLVKNRGETAVVGVQHGVCGGCHMRLPPQLLVTCRAEQEIVTCSNCGRILYYTPDMDMAVAD